VLADLSGVGSGSDQNAGKVKGTFLSMAFRSEDKLDSDHSNLPKDDACCDGADPSAADLGSLAERRDASPYASPHAPPTCDETEPIVSAELACPPRPRVWTALVVGIVAIPVATVIAGMVLGFVAMLDAGPSVFQGSPGMPAWLERYSQTRLGLVVVVVPGQLVFLAMAVGGALLSPLSVRDRLGLRLGVLPLWCWVVLMVATPIIGVLSSHLLSFVVDDVSDQLKLVENMMRTHAHGFLVGLLLLVAVLPGVVEELLFRGYVQSRLLRRWPPLLAVLVSALVFSAAHLDPLHMLGVVPLGIWLGLVAWRADSVIPAMLCHAVNNTVAVIGTACQPPGNLEFTWDPVSIAALAVSGPAFLLSLLLLYFAAPPRRR
jgi:membrane protease YdiL (CAAX protease family)